MGGPCSKHQMKNVYKILTGKHERNRPLGKLDVNRRIIITRSSGKN
jgi:hypothetical protein